MARSNGLQPKRQRAVELLLAGKTHAEVGEALGVRRETIWKWTQNAEVAAELHCRRQARQELVGDLLDAAAVEALQTLQALMVAPEVPPAVRVRAAAQLLDRAGVVATHRVEVAQELQEPLTLQEALRDTFGLPPLQANPDTAAPQQVEADNGPPLLCKPDEPTAAAITLPPPTEGGGPFVLEELHG